MQEDPRLADAKAIPIREVVDRLDIVGLRPAGRELSGPCPLCGGRDRFNINLATHAFLCRQCDIKGGDTVALAQAVLGCDFKSALSALCGEIPASIDPEEVARRRRRAEAAERKRQEDADRYRQFAIRDARSIWSRATLAEDTLARGYLELRGISREVLPVMPRCFRFIPDHPYVVKRGSELVTLHRGPCMISGVLSQRDELMAVHQTWIDLDAPKGKAVILEGDVPQAAKMTRGAVKGGAIRMVAATQSKTMVMGEGIETTLSVLAAGMVSGAAFWAGVSLPNMQGTAAKIPGKRWHGIPDLSDGEAFVPPPWVERLIFLQDGDSDARATRHKLECGLRRAMALRPGLKAQIVSAGAGVDFNDVLLGQARDEEKQ